MTTDRFPSSWGDPQYASAVVGVVAVGALVAYASLVPSAPAVDTVLFVLLWVFVPVVLAHELARRL